MRHLGLFAAAAAAMITTCGPTASIAGNAPAPAQKTAASTGGIQWFTRLKDGLAEAKRTGRPILFLSAAPSCGGVPGVW